MHLYDDSVCFSSVYAAKYTLLSILKSPVVISPNQHPSLLQALKQSNAAYSFSDTDYYGLMQKTDETMVIASDYAGIMPAIDASIHLWSSGAGYVDASETIPQGITIIDLQTLNPLSLAPGAVVKTTDQNLIKEMKMFASLGIEKGHLWNDKIESGGIDALMAPLVREYWSENTPGFIDKLEQVQTVCDYYAERLAGVKPIECMSVRYPRFFPIRLALELYCPKEAIFEAIAAERIDVSVPYKPLYRYRAFEAPKLSGCEDFYKAIIALPVHGIDLSEAKRIADVFIEVIERYGLRSCSF